MAKPVKRWSSIPLAAFAFAVAAIGQTAPQRSQDLCSSLKDLAAQNSRSFSVPRPGACIMNLDKGYDFIVDYTDKTLDLILRVDIGLLGGDASAFWLRLSAFDNLVHAAMHTKQQSVFDKMNKLVMDLAKAALTNALSERSLNSQAEEAVLLASYNPAFVAVMVAATPIGIEKMQRSRERESSPSAATARGVRGGIPTWRKILGLSLLAFGAAAQNAAAAYRPPSFSQSTICYTNFLGSTAVTTCY